MKTYKTSRVSQKRTIFSSHRRFFHLFQKSNFAGFLSAIRTLTRSLSTIFIPHQDSAMAILPAVPAFSTAIIVDGEPADEQQNAITQKTGMTVAELQGMFSTAKLRFWQDLKKLVDSHFERHGWVAIHEAIQAEAAQRQQGLYRSSSKTAAWMPIDVSNAKKRLDGGAGAALPLPTSLPLKSSGDRPKVHVVLCAIGDPESQTLSGEHGVRSIDVTPTDYFQGLLLDTLDVEFYKKLEQDAGVGLCCNTGAKNYEEESLVAKSSLQDQTPPEEDNADMCQLPDARILDAIAGDDTTPPEFSFRPRVCYCQSRECNMQGYRGEIIVRGSSSTGPGDIRTGSSDDPELTELLRCHTNYSHSMDHSGKVHFYQELRKSVADWGEVSVFMVGDTIFSVAMSRGIWTDPDDHHSSFTADRYLTNWSKINRSAQNATREEAHRKEAELRRFAIFQRRELLKRQPQEFESLKVAVRLDIGISEATKDGLFFVINVARWPGADMLSAWQVGSQPYDSIFEAVGKKFALESGRLVECEEHEERQEPEERGEGNDSSGLSDPPAETSNDSD
ncbi:hypothetical protein F52700_4875 [Fusarium sp. NRRL 52700]|nr:hypothetical protein F52700_4875 [Fusarium sp. NRRL 52700]